MVDVALWKRLLLACIPVVALSAVVWAQLPSHAPVPKDNPQTPAKIKLGEQLYFDPRISVTGTVSCNSCHDLMSTFVCRCTWDTRHPQRSYGFQFWIPHSAILGWPGGKSGRTGEGTPDKSS